MTLVPKREPATFDWQRRTMPGGEERWEAGDWSIGCRARVQERAGRRVASAFLFDVWRGLDLVAVRASLDAAMAYAQRRHGPTHASHAMPRTPQRAQQLALADLKFEELKQRQRDWRARR